MPDLDSRRSAPRQEAEMCGLAGRYHAERLASAPDWRLRADALLAHRGPDGSGVFADERCELVHRRLAIQDLSPTGAQPMTNEDGTIQVVFNGEIYNHWDLRRGLVGRGHHLRGTSDTEVLAHLYEEEGPGFVRRLRGIFAIALYDRSRRRLLLARDRVGVKPLYYAGPGTDGEWIFASEIKAILARPGFRPRIDRQACYDFLGLGFIPEPMTGYANIASLPPGGCLTIDPHAMRLESIAVPPPVPDDSYDLDAARERCAERLLDAVASQSVADVPVAALLSGGIDSSLVVAAHCHAVGRAPETFSVSFPDPTHDESAAAAAVAKHCGTRHHAVDATEYTGTTDDLLGLLRHFDQPFADPSCFATYWVARAIRDRGIICALSGDGGDEVFGGYPRFWQAPRLHALAQAPHWVLAAGEVGGDLLTRITADTGRRLAKASHLAYAGREDSSVILSGLSNYLSEEEKASLVAPEARDGLRPCHRLFDGHRPLAAPDTEELSRRMTESMFRVTLPGDMLRKVDMMSMRAGVEIRVPLLDEDVVAVGLALPHRLKTDGRQGKRVLRSLAARWLPRDIARLPKRGFGVPLDVLAPAGFDDALADLLTGDGARTRGLVAPALVRGWLDRFAGRDDSARHGDLSRGGLLQRLLTLVALESWMRDQGLSW
jgi:asparagine synthase (glutamine-hydrolysing)